MFALLSYYNGAGQCKQMFNSEHSREAALLLPVTFGLVFSFLCMFTMQNITMQNMADHVQLECVAGVMFIKPSFVFLPGLLH